MTLTQSDLECIKRAVSDICKGHFKRADLGQGIIVYKVPSNNPDKYTIRIDIKINKGNKHVKL